MKKFGFLPQRFNSQLKLRLCRNEIKCVTRLKYKRRDGFLGVTIPPAQEKLHFLPAEVSAVFSTQIFKCKKPDYMKKKLFGP